MAQFRRPAKQQRLTLARVCLGLTSIVVFLVLLFRADEFPAKRNNRMVASPLTPETLLKQEFVRKKSLAVESESDKKVDGEDSTVANPLPTVTKKYRMELAGLLDGATGTVEFVTHPEWAPIGVDHFEKLVEAEFFDQCRFFRVLPNFIVQFGISSAPEVQKRMREDVIKDDPVEQTNARGTITYATSGPNTRTTQLFINKRDNAYLDKQGFAPFAEITAGMDVIDKIYAEDKEKPVQGKIVNQGLAYLQEEFPNLSYVVSIREIKDATE